MSKEQNTSDEAQNIIDILASNEKQKLTSETISGILFAVFINIFNSFFLEPHVFKDIWLWFIVPMGLKPLTHWTSFGVLCLFGLVLMNHHRVGTHFILENFSKVLFGNNKTQKVFLHSTLVVFSATLIVWGFAYLAS